MASRDYSSVEIDQLTPAQAKAELMRLALERCFSDPRVTGIVIDPLASNERAHRFYRRMGFKPVGRRTFGRDVCLVHELTRRDWLALHRN